MYCVIGKKLPHTLSPQIHREMGINEYGVVELEDEAALLNFVKSGEYAGFNVTIPYKEKIIPLLDIVDAAAAEIGAVNTVVERSGKLYGYNTDAAGMLYALRSANISLKNKNVLVLGSGGTSKTARYVCSFSDAKSVNTVSRSGVLNYENCYKLLSTEIIINTTPAGMMPDAYDCPVRLEKFSNLKGVYDVIYNPFETLLVKSARELGIPAANGFKMLIEQARAAHNIFASEKKDMLFADEDETARIFAKLTKQLENIVIIGMAGSGKSTVGRLVAKKMNRKFIDSDDEIVKEAGMSVPEIFEKKGEAAFREMESRAVQRVSSLHGLVISTGGGAVLSEKNRFFLKSNGKIVLLLRNVDKLATNGRPLSGSAQSAARIWNERKDLYFSFADIVAKNYTTPECVTEEILNKL